MGFHEEYKPGWLNAGFAILIAIIINVAILPTESSGKYGVQFSLVVRMLAWLLFVLISLIYFRFRKKQYAWISALGYAGLFLYANLGNRAASTNWMVFVLSMIMGAAILQVAISRSGYFRGIVIRALELVILTWVLFFVIQSFIFVATGEVVDFHTMFAPYSEQRTEILVSGFARLGGLHIEPGTYANWLYGLVLTRALYQKRMFDRISMLAMCSIPLTASFWGILSFVVYIGGYVISTNWKKIKTVLFSVFLIFLIVIAGSQLDVAGKFMNYVGDRFALTDNSSQAKVQAYTGFAANLDEYIIFGKGYDYDFCGGCYSPQDAGIFLNTVVRIGLAGSVLLFIGFYRRIFMFFGLSGILVALPVLFAKWYYWDNIFWILFLASYFLKNTSVRSGK